MKKARQLILLTIGLLLFLPSIKVSPAQESYVGIQSGDEYLWRLGLFRDNWGDYFHDYLEGTLSNLMPLGPSSDLTAVYQDWVIWRYISPPQSEWPFDVTAISTEETGIILFPFDNTTITSRSVNATAGWKLSGYPKINSYYNGTWYIVNDTSSFLRQTLNLTLAFSPYGIMNVPFAPITINWTSFISEFLGIMKSRGGLYNNISATAYSNGYLLHVPVLGFENNYGAIDIYVKYNSQGVLDYYQFSYGGKILVNYGFPQPTSEFLTEDDIHIFIYGSVFVVAIVLIVILLKKTVNKPRYVGSAY